MPGPLLGVVVGRLLGLLLLFCVRADGVDVGQAVLHVAAQHLQGEGRRGSHAAVQRAESR